MRLRLRITGRVQGVGFRYFTMQAARELGLRGWIQNESDGSVVSEVEGDEKVVDEFLAEVRRGPRFSRVDEVITEPLGADPHAAVEFEIR